MQLPYIEIQKDELNNIIRRVQKGDTPDIVCSIFGGKEFKVEHRKEKDVYFWRFRILDAITPQDEYEIFMGEFERDKLIFGVLLPKG